MRDNRTVLINFRVTEAEKKILDTAVENEPRIANISEFCRVASLQRAQEVVSPFSWEERLVRLEKSVLALTASRPIGPTSPGLITPDPFEEQAYSAYGPEPNE